MELLSFIHDTLIQTAHAQDVWQQYYAPFGGPGTGPAFIKVFAWRTANLVLKLITGGAVLAIMWGGLKMITSAGNEEGKESAKKIVMFAIGGLLLSILAEAAIVFTRDFVTSFTN
ncbi:hypothetical protein COU78_03255 [Candidatus Peregrinibacteria bacterium CG10_big_fil_rev_8_21_14_0_10_49_24]|nr:MAG: hypothetical protein COV83_05075 [Candidatus Peregrinibacteria bacterium CG11_big_fil_rev_8_21_14_0_20_49_14]PIR51142.1 MAG: hypothetical protein COU78_03255 [Candidatus Peregrinibacteria bacterium CG10_big_fil_rev_8_21_14_0_10_49_24]PJA67181.1 MAG: hypothetical protein CO157_05410 [Candidatus Peregrinibacteria bacterium CG_4_9_14_3_um_filter_49_12]